MLAALVSPEASPLGLQVALLTVSSHGLPSVLMRVCVLISSSNKDISHIGLGPTHMILFYFNHLFKGAVSRYSHILRSWGLGLQHMNLGGYAIQPITREFCAPSRTSCWTECLTHVGTRLMQGPSPLLSLPVLTAHLSLFFPV